MAEKKPRNSSETIAGLLAEIRTENRPTTRRDREPTPWSRIEFVKVCANFRKTLSNSQLRRSSYTLPLLDLSALNRGTRWRSWLRHYATSRMVAGSIPEEVIVYFFNWPNPSSRTVALGSTQPLTEMSTRNLPGGKGGRPVRKADNFTVICEPIV
jgi:hypothetical protein